MNFGVGQIGLAVSLLVCVSCASAVVVTLSDGTRLRGTENGGVASFKGIAFAAPPVGPLRWTPPQPWVNPAPAEIVDATQFGSPCKQTRDGEVLGDEDCLFLNVYVNLEKAGADSGRHITPVGLYIHGGSYINGAGSDYDGSDFVNFWNGSVIVVSTNYRLNVFGFSGSDELRVQDSIAGSTANYGLFLSANLYENESTAHIAFMCDLGQDCKIRDKQWNGLNPILVGRCSVVIIL